MSGRVRSHSHYVHPASRKTSGLQTIIGYLSKEGFKRWNTLPISRDEEAQKDPEAVVKAIADTLEVLTSYWNHIDEIYSDIKQGDSESTDQLDQQIKNLVERCQYTADEKLALRTELLFHVTKHFKVKKWVRLKKKREDVTYQALLQYTKEHEMMVKDFNRHKSNGGIAQQMTIDVIKTFKHGKKGTRNGSSHRADGLSNKDSKTCSKCNTTHSYKDCPEKCHKCGFKIISVLAADQLRVMTKAKDAREVEHQLVAGAQKDVTDPTEADALGQSQV